MNNIIRIKTNQITSHQTCLRTSQYQGSNGSEMTLQGGEQVEAFLRGIKLPDANHATFTASDDEYGVVDDLDGDA
jgi:hypothetical protein